jgi:5-carboxymethyl-2-hydroxymuconate isomerase
MTTASLTRNNVTNNTPVVHITRRNGNEINAMTTACDFCRSNIRHVVNRRMRWSTTENFVRNAFVALVLEVRKDRVERMTKELSKDIGALVDQVRIAANRRKGYYTVASTIEGFTAALIDKASL